jgi:hypothetical protein
VDLHQTLTHLRKLLLLQTPNLSLELCCGYMEVS